MQVRFNETATLLNKKPLTAIYNAACDAGCQEGIVTIYRWLYSLVLDEKRITPSDNAGNDYQRLQTAKKTISVLTRPLYGLSEDICPKSFSVMRDMEEVRILTHLLRVCVEKYDERIAQIEEDLARQKERVDLWRAYEENNTIIDDIRRKKKIMEEVLINIS